MYPDLILQGGKKTDSFFFFQDQADFLALAEFLTWSAVALFHPDVAVVLCHASLRVQEGHSHAALSTEAGVVAATVFNGLFIELVTQPESRKSRKQERRYSNNTASIQLWSQLRTQQNASG